MALKLKSYNQIVGDMLRKLFAVTGLNDANKGSVLTTLLEAAAQEDFSQYGSLIELLDNFSLDTTSGADLDKKAAEFNISRLSSTASSGFVTITDSTFDKVSTGIFIGASPPIAGDTVINVNDASEFAFPGSVYIGRGTPNFEGPIAQSIAPIDNGSYWTVTLATPLSKNHSLNEKVIFAQGGDRTVPAGTIVKIPANNISSEVSFKIAANELLADGENTLNNVLVFAIRPGSSGNAPLGSIVQFESLPFNGAVVTNPAPFSNARDLESDQDLRDRIKNHIQSLSKGTSTAIVSGVVGITDSDDNKRVASASLIEPTDVADIAELFIDDGTGFEPSFTGQGLESIIDEAAGTEQFLQLGNFPVVKAQVESENEQPFLITNGMTLIVRVNNEEETIVFLTSDFSNPQSIKATDVAQAINNKSTLIEARTSQEQKRVVIFAKTINNEKIQVIGGTANDVLLFPTDEVYTIRLYKNDILLSKDGETAFVESASFSDWSTGSFGTPSTFNVQVDGKHVQYLRINDNALEVSVDGSNYVTVDGTTFDDLGTSLATADLSQWVTILDQLIVGAEVTANGDKIRITSNQENVADSKIQILELGTPSNLISPQGWPTELVVGKQSDFVFNRFNGQIELVQPLSELDTITAGTRNTRGSVLSAKSVDGTFDLSVDNGRDPYVYVVVDGNIEQRTLNAVSGSTITVAASGLLWRYTSSVAAFTDLEIGDYVVIQYQTAGAWLGTNNTGIFRVEVVDSNGFYFEVYNPNGGVAGPAAIDEATDLQAFYSNIPPQKIPFTVGVNTIAQVQDTINSYLIGGFADTTDNSAISISTNTYDDDVGSIAVVAIGGNAENLGFDKLLHTSGVSHIASIQSSSELGLRVQDGFGSITTADVSDPYTTIVDSTRLFTSDNITKPNQWIKFQNGTNEDIKGIIRSINSNTDLLLRDNTPSLVSAELLGPVGTDHQYQQYVPFDLEDTDNLVVVMDDDEINKIHNVPMSRKGRINTLYSTTTFDAIDVDANVSGTSFGDTLWDGYDFADYKMWLKARNVINPTNDKNAIIVRAKQFGPTGERIRVGYTYNVSPNQDLSASVVSSGDNTTVLILLGTGPTVTTTHDGTTQFDITTGVGSTTYTWDTNGTNPGLGLVSVGDIVTFNSPNFASGNNGTFRISATDNATYITVQSATGVVESNKTLGNTAAMVVFGLIGDTAADVVAYINDTAPINDIIEAILTTDDPFGTTNDGSGTIDYSTLDDPAITSQYVDLVDSENWVRDFSNPVSPFFTLKQALQLTAVIGGVGNIYEIENAPVYNTADIGEPFRLIPVTAKNLVDHINQPTITSLSLDATVSRADGGDKLQVASNLVGSQGQVQITGGLANDSLAAIIGNAAPSGTSLKVAVDKASIGGFHATQAIKVANLSGSKKLNTFDSSTVVTVSTSTPKTYTLNKRDLNFVVGVSDITITSLGSNQFRLTVANGGTFSNVYVHDELSIPRSTSPFDARNEGTFPIINIDVGGTYIDIINPDGFAEGPIIIAASTDLEVMVPFFTEWPKELSGTTQIRVEKLSQDFVRYRWTGIGSDPNFLTNGVRVDDIVTIGGAKFSISNRGRFRIVGVKNDFIEVVNASAIEEIVTLNETILNSSNVGDNVSVTTSGNTATYTLATTSFASIPAPGSRVYIPSTSPFAAGNEGVFKVLASTTNSVTVINASGVVEGPIALTATSDMQFENSFSFLTLDSAEVGDTLSVAAIANSWFDEKNQGQIAITAVGRASAGTHRVTVNSSNFTGSPDVISLGTNIASFLVLEGSPFVTYRTIDNITVNPSNTNQRFMFYSPATHANRFNRAVGSQIIAMNKLGFPKTPKEGIDGYKYYTGLLRRVQRTVNGYDADLTTFPGIAASGVQLEVKPPLLQRVAIGVDVKTTSGTPVSILIDAIKSAMLSYITSLGVGEDVILSQIVKRVQEVSGVEAVRITNPAPTNNEAPERIIISDNEKAIASEDDITVG